MVNRETKYTGNLEVQVICVEMWLQMADSLNHAEMFANHNSIYNLN